jgi:pantothenate kinase
MIAGVDFGSTLVKAVWHVDSFQYAMSRYKSLEEILKDLRNDGVNKLYVAGIHYKKKNDLKGFKVIRPEGDAIQGEIEMQAKGTRQILEIENVNLESFLLVSIGTGTSYTSVNLNEAFHFPIGNSIGGGFIMGLGQYLGAGSFSEIAELASKGKPANLLIKDLLPEKAGTLQGEFVISNFGRKITRKEDACASIMSCVATATIKDILLMSSEPKFDHKNIVYIGSSLHHNPTLKNMLEEFTLKLGKKPFIPENGCYSLAMGAYLAGLKESEKRA